MGGYGTPVFHAHSVAARACAGSCRLRLDVPVGGERVGSGLRLDLNITPSILIVVTKCVARRDTPTDRKNL